MAARRPAAERNFRLNKRIDFLGRTGSLPMRDGALADSDSSSPPELFLADRIDSPSPSDANLRLFLPRAGEREAGSSSDTPATRTVRGRFDFDYVFGSSIDSMVARLSPIPSPAFTARSRIFSSFLLYQSSSSFREAARLRNAERLCRAGVHTSA